MRLVIASGTDKNYAFAFNALKARGLSPRRYVENETLRSDVVVILMGPGNFDELIDMNPLNTMHAVGMALVGENIRCHKTVDDLVSILAPKEPTLVATPSEPPPRRRRTGSNRQPKKKSYTCPMCGLSLSHVALARKAHEKRCRELAGKPSFCGVQYVYMSSGKEAGRVWRVWVPCALEYKGVAIMPGVHVLRSRFAQGLLLHVRKTNRVGVTTVIVEAKST